MTYDNMIELRSKLLTMNAGTILDVACGRGDFLKFALRSFNSYRIAVGIDPDIGALNQARENLFEYPVSFVVGSAMSMPFLSESFTTITLSNALHHIADHKTLFKEMQRICRPDGIMLINEMIQVYSNEYQETYNIYHHYISELDTLMGLYHRDTYSEKEIHQIVKENRLNVAEFFVHEDITRNQLNVEDISQMIDKMNRKVLQLKNTDSYYFYLNKAKDIEKRIRKTGIQRPDHIALIIRP